MRFNILEHICIILMLFVLGIHAAEDAPNINLNPTGLNSLIEKIGNITLTIRFRPLTLLPWYNRLQIPTFTHIFKMHENPNKTMLLSEEELVSRVAKGQFSLWTKTTLNIKCVTGLDEVSEEITFVADFTLHWTDLLIYGKTYLEFKFTLEENKGLTAEHTGQLWKTIDNEIMKQIWKPDIFIENTVEITYPELMSKPVSVRVNELVGGVVYTARIRVQMACEMDFHFYPADIQKCKVILRSNSYSSEELTLFWANPGGVSLDNCEGSKFDFRLGAIGAFLENEVYLNNIDRNFTALRLTILARRKLSYHMVQTFLPSLFFIVITWLCFLIPSAEVRIGVAMTTLLTLTAMFSAVRGNSPKVTYVRAIDIWMLACIIFVFLTLLEFVYVVWARNKKEEFARVQNANRDDSSEDDLDSESPSKAIYCSNIFRKDLFKRIDKYAVFIFSTIFIVFCVFYWRWLILSSGYLAWNVGNTLNCVDG